MIFFLNFFITTKNKTKNEEDKISVVVNLKDITNEKHILFYKIMTALNSKRNYYYIKTIGKPLKNNLNQIVENSTVKIVQSNFPDSIFLPLVVSLYGKNIPELILFIQGEDLIDNKGDKLIKWYNYAYMQIIINNYDYIFGNFQIINGKKIGCSLLLSKASVIQHLLYYTNSDTTHINPFIQLSIAKETNFCFIPFNYVLKSQIENTQNKFSQNMDCPSIKDNKNPLLCILLPIFKRNYFYYSIPSFLNQTYQPKFYVIIQNDDMIHLNLTYIQKRLKKPVYHIWMKNWNSFFFLNHRISSLFPCDFVLKYDDDQWPNDNKIQENLIKKAKNKNIMLGGRNYTIKKSICGYYPKSYKKNPNSYIDHIATPFLIRPGYFKLDARKKIYSLYHAEDVTLSIHSFKLCNVESKYTFMKIIEKHKDGNQHEADKQFVSLKVKAVDLFRNSYCYLIRSGYIPKTWNEFHLHRSESIEIDIDHKALN